MKVYTILYVFSYLWNEFCFVKTHSTHRSIYMNVVNIISDKSSLKKTSLSSVYLGKTTSRENCLENLTFEKFEERYSKSKYAEKKKLSPKILTLECFDLQRVLSLISYMEDIIASASSSINNTEESKLKRQLAILKNIVGQSSYVDCFFQKDLLYRSMGYCYILKGDVGRLYSYTTSIPAMSRSVRFLLFQKIYTDVDMVNAHPSILAKYAYEHNIETPTLLNLVNDRNAFYKVVSSETNIEIDDVKKRVIMIINQTEKMFLSGNNSEILKRLFNDILKVRNSIYEETKLKNNHFLFEKKRYKASDLERKKVSIQSYYCQTQESELLLDLYWFLKEIEGNVPLHQLPLVFIPFFDGAYIRFDNPRHQLHLNQYIEEYNSKSRFIKFKEKSLEKEGTLLDEALLNKYIVLSRYLQKVSQDKIYKIMASLDITTGYISDDIVNLVFEESTSLKAENLRLSEQITLIRKPLREKKLTKEQKKDYTAAINILIKERKNTYNYVLRDKNRIYVEKRIKEKLFSARKVLLEHCADEKTLHTFLEGKLLNSSYTEKSK